MIYFTYEEWNNTKQQNIDKLIFNNERYIKEKNNIAFIISIPKIELSYINNKNSLYIDLYRGLNASKDINITIPDMILYKTVFYSNNKNIFCIYDPSNIYISKELNLDFNVFIENILHIIDNEIQKLYRLVYDIKKYITHIDFFISYKLIEYIDKILLYTGYYISFINDLSTLIKILKIKINKSLNDQILNISDIIKHLVDISNQTRHATMQRIAYLDSGTARFLTVIATIFLPASFLVSLASMQFKDNPFKKFKYPFIIFIIILFLILIISIILFRKEFF